MKKRIRNYILFGVKLRCVNLHEGYLLYFKCLWLTSLSIVWESSTYSRHKICIQLWKYLIERTIYDKYITCGLQAYDRTQKTLATNNKKKKSFEMLRKYYNINTFGKWN